MYVYQFSISLLYPPFLLPIFLYYLSFMKIAFFLKLTFEQHFEKAITKSGSQYLVGDSLTYVDISLFYVIQGRFSFFFFFKEKGMVKKKEGKKWEKEAKNEKARNLNF